MEARRMAETEPQPQLQHSSSSSSSETEDKTNETPGAAPVTALTAHVQLFEPHLHFTAGKSGDNSHWLIKKNTSWVGPRFYAGNLNDNNLKL